MLAFAPRRTYNAPSALREPRPAPGKCEMQFKVASWLKQPVGYARTFELDDDLSRLADELEPTRPLTGRIELMRIHSGILVTGVCRTIS